MSCFPIKFDDLMPDSPRRIEDLVSAAVSQVQRLNTARNRADRFTAAGSILSKYTNLLTLAKGIFTQGQSGKP
jgi:hypothetical protein